MSEIDKIITLKKNAETTSFVGDPEDMIPFAWRQPICIEDRKKISRVLKTMQQAESERIMSAVPAHTDN